MLELSREKSDDCVLLCGMLYVHNSSEENGYDEKKSTNSSSKLVKSKEKHFLPTRMKFSFIVKNKCFVVIDFEKKNY